MSALPRLHRPALPAVGETFEVAGDEAHYLARVLRVRPGDRFVLFGAGEEERVAEVVSVPSAQRITAVAVEARAGAGTSPLRLGLAVGLAKGTKLDWVVEKATELGVGEILPFRAARSVARIDADRAAARTARWRRIAREAARQSRRGDVPRIPEPVDFAALLASTAHYALRVLYWEGAAPEDAPLPAAADSALVVTGPEGGFEASEVAAARSAGVRIAPLGPRVLRAETAAIVAVAFAQRAWGDLR